MRVLVNNVYTPCVLKVVKPWNFHGVKGTKVSMVGLHNPPKEELQKCTQEVAKLLRGKEIDIVERWFVKGQTLHAVIHFKGQPVWNLFPNRRTPLIEPSRKFNPYDQVPLVRVSGGLPPSWKNPLSRVKNINSIPFFGNIQYPIKWWEEGYEESLKIAEKLYCHERDGSTDQERRLQTFFNTRDQNTLVIFGDTGIGKTWFVLHNILNHRPIGSHYAYIDLRGRPKGDALIPAIHRDLGLFLDRYINDGPDPIGALAHYLEPIVRPLCVRRTFDPKGLYEQDKMQEVYFRLASDPVKLIDYNDVRLGYYDNTSVRMYIIVDNVDNYAEDEQKEIYEFVTRTLLGHSGIRVIIPLRPTSELLISRMDQALDIISTGVDLCSPAISNLLHRICSQSIHGVELSLDRFLPGSKQTWKNLLKEYLDSDAASLLRDLCSSEADIPPHTYKLRLSVKRRRIDCRHYIRLFRRLLFSDVLQDFCNINSEYYAVHALVLRPGEPMLPQSAFLLNLFDNDLPEIPGNALIRYRVLEYFHSNSDIGPLFDSYFRALGPGPRVARRVLDLFISSGFIMPNYGIDTNTGEIFMRSAAITCAGQRHFAVTRNLWYGICVKTGMHVEPEMIKRADDAIKAARLEVGIESRLLLEFYASNGWVSDKDFIDFLWRQEELESRRIADFQENEPGMLMQIAGLLEDLNSPAEILGQIYGEQLHYWKRKGETI